MTIVEEGGDETLAGGAQIPSTDILVLQLACLFPKIHVHIVP